MPIQVLGASNVSNSSQIKAKHRIILRLSPILCHQFMDLSQIFT